MIVAYEPQNNQGPIDYFEESSNFEGFATLRSINLKDGVFFIEGFDPPPISLDYLVVLNQLTNEYEYFEKD